MPRTVTLPDMPPILGIPVATILILIVAIVGAVQLIVYGHLSNDFPQYAGIVGGSSGLLAIGRGIDAHTKP